MITKKGSKAYEAGLICRPNLDTLIPNARRNARIFGFSMERECLEENYSERRIRTPVKKIEPIKKKFDW